METMAWQIAFSSGYMEPLNKTSNGWVRCAREAPENVCDCPKCEECQECEQCQECEECPVCPVCESGIKFDANCNLTGLTTYSELKAKRAKLSKAIKELKKCHSAATRAMNKARKAERKALRDKKKAEKNNNKK